MPFQFTSETAIFETVDVNHPAVPRHCGLCKQNPPALAYRFGGFTDSNQTGYCCAPCACRHLVEMAERGASGGRTKDRNAS